MLPDLLEHGLGGEAWKERRGRTETERDHGLGGVARGHRQWRGPADDVVRGDAPAVGTEGVGHDKRLLHDVRGALGQARGARGEEEDGNRQPVAPDGLHRRVRLRHQVPVRDKALGADLGGVSADDDHVAHGRELIPRPLHLFQQRGGDEKGGRLGVGDHVGDLRP